MAFCAVPYEHATATCPDHSYFVFFFIHVAYRQKLNILASTPPTADCNSTAHARLQLRPLGANKQLFYPKQTQGGHPNIGHRWFSKAL